MVQGRFLLDYEEYGIVLKYMRIRIGVRTLHSNLHFLHLGFAQRYPCELVKGPGLAGENHRHVSCIISSLSDRWSDRSR